jgi:hypothetical protein
MKSSSRHDLFTFWHERYVIDKMISKSSYEHPAVLSTYLILVRITCEIVGFAPPGNCPMQSFGTLTWPRKRFYP